MVFWQYEFIKNVINSFICGQYIRQYINFTWYMEFYYRQTALISNNLTGSLERYRIHLWIYCKQMSHYADLGYNDWAVFTLYFFGIIDNNKDIK